MRAARALLAGATLLAALLPGDGGVIVAPSRLAPGTPVLFAVEAPESEVPAGSFLQQELTFVRHAGRWLAFAGVDLDAAPGTHVAELKWRRADGTEIHRRLDLVVEKKDFPVERLQVEPRYVEPPPEVSERIARDRAALEALWARPTGEYLAGGEVVTPLKGVKGRNFGRRRVFNGQPRSPHSGTDLSAPEGTAVEAAAAGRVVLAEEQYFSGNLVVLDHGGGVYTLYAHLSRMEVVSGETVAAGAVLGRVGATGRVTGAHLHWGARIGAARVDPVVLLDLIMGTAVSPQTSPSAVSAAGTGEHSR